MSEKTNETRPFIMIPEDVIFSDSLNAIERSILMSLVYICDEEDNNNNTCSPTIKGISAMTGFCTTTVRKYLKLLEAKGFLKIEPQTNEYGGQKSHLYTLNIL